MDKKYVKYISENTVELAPTNYHLEDGSIIFNFDQDPKTMLKYSYKPLTESDKPENDRRYKITYKEPSKTIEEILTYTETEEEYEARKEKEERERLDKMSLTPADVWRALYKAKKMRSNELLDLIRESMTGIDMNLVEIEFGAKDFYRGAMLGTGRLFDVVGELLDYTPEDINYLFLHKELPEKQ